jgi:hypothetical protein
MDKMISFGEYLRHRREQLGLPLRKVAAELDIQETIKYVEYKGVNYIVDGHHHTAPVIGSSSATSGSLLFRDFPIIHLTFTIVKTMFKIKFSNGVYYLLTKYIIFFSILAFIGNRFKIAVIDNAETFSELVKLTFGYILYILFDVVLLTLIFSYPVYCILKINSGIYSLLLLMIFYVIEFYAYCYFYSPSDKAIGIYNSIIGIVFLNLFFYKHMVLKFRRLM